VFLIKLGVFKMSFTVKVFAVFSVFLCFAVIPHAVFAGQPCSVKTPRLSFNSEIKSTEYIRTESAQNLTQWQMGHGAMIGPKVLGVGGGSLGTKIKILYEMTDMGDDTYCITPKQIAANFLATPQIHVASNFARGSCEYSEVLAHEQKHISILRKFHREYQALYNKKFRGIVKEMPAITSVSLDEAEGQKAKITNFVVSNMNDYVQIMMADLNDRQRAIDTRDEYDSVLAKCENWNEKLAK
jgi:hypothetical protein